MHAPTQQTRDSCVYGPGQESTRSGPEDITKIEDVL